MTEVNPVAEQIGEVIKTMPTEGDEFAWLRWVILGLLFAVGGAGILIRSLYIHEQKNTKERLKDNECGARWHMAIEIFQVFITQADTAMGDVRAQ